MHVVAGGVPKWGRLGHPIETPGHDGPGAVDPRKAA
jgi:hypothetical protein